VQVIWKWWLGW